MTPVGPASLLKLVQVPPAGTRSPLKREDLVERLSLDLRSPERFLASLPFSVDDVTAGSENELQTVVRGDARHVDLPLTISSSSYLKNTHRKTLSGDAPPHILSHLEKHLSDNPEGIWENSWVRFPYALLKEYTRRIFQRDLLSDKCNMSGPYRCDSDRFFCRHEGDEYLRIPVSYLLKIALAQAVAHPDIHPLLKETAEHCMGHFLSDNTSPETFSFAPVGLCVSSGMGKGLARETSLRFLFSQLLTQYANRCFQLDQRDQKAQVYFSPHPLMRQKKLNDLISDSFYRELFMSPCLSGWDKGEAKHQYMALCHQVLSRSQLNAVIKLREAGIITRNLVVLPNLSNISLANNGTHISLGSRKLTRLLSEPSTDIRGQDEKYYGDLAIKIIEHFLPLFVGTYSADPYRIDFSDFHPEKILGFLPHELDFTHLRMIWRRWKKKADLGVMGHAFTPFGPEKLDRWFSRLLGLKGDFVKDFRLIDYPVSLLSTARSPALSGHSAHEKQLRKDLTDMGVFDTAMPLYQLYRLRKFDTMGFSGFEGRFYSQFSSLGDDMAHAVNLQTLVTALAHQYVLRGDFSHEDIPDDPSIESERRQIFFGTAIGIPTFYVRADTPNRFMLKILQHTKGTRMSRRYGGYIRVPNIEYRKALLTVLSSDARGLIGVLQLQDTLADLSQRIAQPEIYSAGGKLTAGILSIGGASHPMKLNASEFNSAAEQYYREDLKCAHIKEALDLFTGEIEKLDAWDTWRQGYYNQPLLDILKGKSAVRFLKTIREEVTRETASAKHIKKLIHLMLLVLHMNMETDPSPEKGTH